MSYTALIGIINAITSVSLGSFVLYKNPRGKPHQAYFLFGLSVGIYSVGYFLWGLAASANDALFAFKVLTSGIIIINSFYLEFIFNLLGTRRQKNIVLLLIHIINAAFVLLTWSEQLFHQVEWKNVWGYWPNPKWIFYVYFLAWTAQFSYGLLSLRQGYSAVVGNKATQLKYVFVSTFIGYLGGGTNWLPWFNINFPPHLNALVSVYVAILAYAIIRHRLLGIEIIIKKTLVFTGLLMMVMGIIAIVTAVSQGALGGLLHLGTKASMGLSGLIIILLYEPTRKILVSITDRYLFQKPTEIKDILRNLSKRVITIVDLDQIGRTILNSLSETLRFASGLLMLHDKMEQNYRVLDHCGISSVNLFSSIQKLVDNEEIIKYFEAANDIVNIEQAGESHADMPAAVSEWLSIVDGHLCIPLQVDKLHFGLLVLGKKKSDQEYSEEEIDCFPTIASQTELAIRNACLIETLIEEREAKVQAEHLAKRVKFAGLIKHEIKNKLVHIEGPANEVSTYLVPRLKRSFNERDEEEFDEFCDKIREQSGKINDAVRKILVIAQTASGGVDEKSETMQELDCKVLWEDAKRESGLLEKCDFESKMPDGFTLFGNYHALQRVFVNLLINAYDAMAENNEPLIKLRCFYHTIEDKPVTYFELEDSGCGIPEEIRDRIFENGFSTKSKPHEKDLISSGYGQGLAACKMYIENIHHGKLWVESEVGKGAIFKFWLPGKDR